MVEAARAGGRAIPALWPLGTEALALAMEVSVLEAKRLRQRAVLGLSWVLLVASVALSTVLQVAVAPPTLVGYVTAGATPVWLLGSFAVLSLLYRAGQPTRPDTVPARPPVTAGAARTAGGWAPATSAQAAAAPRLPARPGAQPAGAARRPGSQARGQAVRAGDEALLARARQLDAAHQAAHGRGVSRDKLRAELGVGASRAERLLAQLATGQPGAHPAGPSAAGNGHPARPAGLAVPPAAARPGGSSRDGQDA
jgi:hypothetical protein